MADLIDKGWITRGTPEYDEVVRFLGSRARWVKDERARQINQRWLKVDCFVRDGHGRPLLNAVGDAVVTKSRRIRIPRDSYLRRRRFQEG